MLFLRQATASQEILLGPFLDSTDGVTPETGLSIAAADIVLWKEGTTTEFTKNLGGATHIAGGRYYTVLDNTDTNFTGKLELNIHMAGALPVRREYMVLSGNVYDSLVYGTDNLDVSAVQLAGQTITAAAGVTFPSNVASPTNITGGTLTTVTNLTNLPAIPANWITAAGITASALNGKGDWLGASGVAAAVWNAAVASYGTAGSYGELIETNLDAQVSTAGGGSLTAADIAAAVWDEAISGHLTAGSTGSALNGAGSSGDPWTATLGGYGAGTAGKIVYDNLDATVSSRASQASVDAVDDLLDTEVAAIKADTAAILTDTAVLGADGAGLTAIPWNASWDTEVQSEVQDAIEANHLDHLLAVDYDPAAKPGTSTALLNELVGSDAGVSQFTANALELAPSGTGASAASIVAAMFTTDTGETEASAVAGSPVYEIVQNAGGGSAPTAAAIRAEIDSNSTQLAAILTDTAVIGAAGAGLTAVPWNSAWDVEVQSECADALAAYDPPTQAELLSAHSTTDALITTVDGVVDSIKTDTAAIPTTAAIAGAVWDKTAADHVIVGSTGEALSAGGDGGGASAADIANAVWEEALTDHATAGSTGAALADAGTGGDPWGTDISGYGASTAGKLVYDNLDATVSSRATQTSVDTVDDLLDTELPALTAVVDAIKTDTGNIESDTTDIQTRLPVALVNNRIDANLSSISNSTQTLAAFNRAVKGNCFGTVGIGSTTTSVVSSNVFPSGGVADKYKGRMIVFTYDTVTVNLRGQATEITSNTSAADPTFTVVALTTAPVAGDDFGIV